jgi:NADPH2:quinone reductase
MPKSIVIERTGGPEVMTLTESPEPEPGPDEIVLRHTAIGVNFIDVYYRTGLYTPPHLPLVLGMEGAGVVERVGSTATDFKPGDRVAYAGHHGAYSELRTLAADRAVRLPAHISDATAAAVMLKGLTAEYLLCRIFPVNENHTILFHAAAGGVGSLACQWAKLLGARVIGTVGSQEKVAIATANGCDHVLLTSDPSWSQQVRDLTRGVGVDVVYDSIGNTTFMGSLACLKTRGMLALFGQSSGKVPPLDVSLLAKSSLFLTRPTLMDYTRARSELQSAARNLFSVLGDDTNPARATPATKKIHVNISVRYPLADAALAHTALESRKTVGSTILVP